MTDEATMLKAAREASALEDAAGGLSSIADMRRAGELDDTKVMRSALAAIRTYVEMEGAPGVRIKPLEWRRPPGSLTLSRADTEFGTYRVWNPTDSDYGWVWSLESPEGAKSRGAASAEIAAKAACQADFERRIRAAIEEVPAEPDAALRAENERLREALTKIAAFDDELAEHALRIRNTYSGFDEPGSVQIARAALKGGSNG